MSVENEFLVYGMEEYKAAHAMTGAAVAALFSKFGVFDYVRRHYDALHTTGGAYLVGDIDDYLKARGGGHLPLPKKWSNFSESGLV